MCIFSVEMASSKEGIVVNLGPIPSSGHSAHKPNDPGGSGGTCGPSLHFSYVHRSNGAHDPGDLDMAEAPAILVPR